MTDQTEQSAMRFDRWDILAAGLVGAGALAVYVRTLAPDILYGDSAEIQTLAYTLGITHTTGYPTFLLLVKLFMFLPIKSVAWRANFASAFMGAATLVGLYFLVRQMTRSRFGAALACLALGISYTFWAEAIIAEHYTAASLCLVGILLLLWHWQEDPARRPHSLFFAGALVGIGIHTMIELAAPAVAIFVLWTLAGMRQPAHQWRRTILWGLGGLLAGAAVYLLAFLVFDLINPPSSFINTTLIPSRSLWGATSADLDTYFKRLYATVVSLQWKGALFSGDPGYMAQELKIYLGWLVGKDFGLPVIVLGVFGMIPIFRQRPRWGGFLLITLAIMLFFLANYKVSGNYVFYIATYVLVALAAGVGAGTLLDLFYQAQAKLAMAKFGMAKLRRLGLGIIYPILAILAAVLIVLPFWSSRWQALKAGSGTFIQNDYTYPLKNLEEPRQIAEERLSYVEDNAVLVLEWRTLYATYYVAHVEQGRYGIRMYEGAAYPADGSLPDTLVEEIKAALKAGKPVYFDHPYRNMERNFRALPVGGADLLRIKLREG
jgi:Protein of unknown function (DUF2723)